MKVKILVPNHLNTIFILLFEHTNFQRLTDYIFYWLDPNPKEKMCPACKMGVEKMESMLEDEHDPEKIKEALTEMCPSLPKEFQDKCKHMIGKEHIAMIIEEILKGDTPEMICQNMGWCDKTAGVQGIKSSSCTARWETCGGFYDPPCCSPYKCHLVAFGIHSCH